MGYLLGIDIGTSGTKTGLYNYQGELIMSSFSEYPLMQPKVGWAEQNPEDWWQAVKTTIKTILLKSSISSSEIKGIGLSGQMHGLVILDKNNSILRPAIIWADQRTDKQVRWLEENIGVNTIIKYTSNPPLPNFTATKLLWVKENEPKVYSEIDKVLLPKDFIRYKLTGEFATDVSDASGTLLLDVRKRDWSEDMINLIGIKQEWLPKVYESYEVTGVINDYCSKETGLAENTPVVGGAGDQAAGAVGNGIVQNGTASIVIGTSGVVFASTDEIKEDSLGRLHTFCHAVPGKWHVMGVTQAAGGSLQWFRNEFGQLETTLSKSLNRDPYELFSEEAEQITPGSEGLLFLPYLMGERTPHLDSQAKGTFVGITSRHGKAHFIRAIMEGVAFSLKDSLEIIRKMDIEINDIYASGGGARSNVWRSILASSLNTTISTIKANEGPSFGAALLAGVGINVYKNVEEACEKTIQIASNINPKQDDINLYNDYYKVYQSLYDNLKESFVALHQLSTLDH